VLAPLLAALPKDRDHYAGMDFGRFADRTDIDICGVDALLRRHHALIVELIDCPVDVQQLILFWVLDRVPRFRHIVMDANGNGFGLAEATRQREGYGPERVTELKPSEPWYLQHMPDFIGSFAGGGCLLPKHQDLRDDLAMLRRVGGVVKVPAGTRRTGSDGGPRHGDAAMATVYADAASRTAVEEYGYETPAEGKHSSWRTAGDDDDDDNDGGGSALLRGW